MKKKIGTLKGSPIVDGDINLVRYPEIHQKTLSVGQYTNSEPFKITMKELTGSDGISRFFKSFIFPVNVIIPKGAHVVMPVITYNSVTKSFEMVKVISINIFANIVPANVGVVIISKNEKELSFVPTNEKLSLTTPITFNGIGIYQDTPAQDIIERLDTLGLLGITPRFDSIIDITFTPLEEGSIIPKYTPIWMVSQLES